MTEESKPAKAARESGAPTETPVQRKLTEVPSRAAQVNSQVYLT